MIKYVSASQITTYLDCPRKWYFQSILKDRQPPSPALSMGLAYHKQIEDFILDGTAPTFSSIQKSLGGFLAETLQEVVVDRHVERSIESLGVQIAGLSIKGFVDLSGFDELGRLHIVDHKTTGNLDLAMLTPAGLLSNAQLVLYAHVLACATKHQGWVQLTHIYYSTKCGKHQKTSAEIHTDAITKKFQELECIVEQMKLDSVKEVHNLMPSKTACSKWGGCHLLQKCGPIPYKPEGKLSIFSTGEKNMIKPTRPQKQEQEQEQTPFEVIRAFELSHRNAGTAGSDSYWDSVEKFEETYGVEAVDKLRDQAFGSFSKAPFSAAPVAPVEEDYGIAPPDASDFAAPPSGDDVPIEAINGLGTRTRNALLAAGFETLGDLKEYAGVWSDLPGLGSKGVGEIRELVGEEEETPVVVVEEETPVAPVVVVEEETPVIEEETPASAKTILLIGAMPVKGFDNVVIFEEVVAALAREIEKELGRAYYSIGGFFEARDLAAGLLHERSESLLVGKTIVVTNVNGPVMSAMLDVVIPIADIVIRGQG